MEKLKLIKCWKTLLLLISMSLFSGTIFAQGITLRGKVVDQKGEPLIGATVKIKATPTTATTTNISGDFTLHVPASTTAITISYIGYVSVDVPVKPNSSNLGSIPLANDANSLSEVVVVGYGVQNKRDVTGATTSVDAAQLAEVPSSNISSQLQGKVSGLDVVAASGGLGATPTIHIRGNRTIGAAVNSPADQPLLVVDGVPYTGTINDINPGDIKNVEVLKDASATAIYGSRGSGGVILITTNRGRAGRSITSLNAYYGVENVIDYLHVLNGTQYAQLKSDALQGSVLQGFGPTQTYPLAPLEVQGLANGTNTNWQKALYQTAYVADQNLNISGGSETTTFNVGAGYRVETGVEPNQRLERYSLQTVIDHKVSKTIRVGVNVTNTLTYNNQPGGFQGLNAAQTTPLSPIFNPDGTFDIFPYAGQTDSSFPSPLYAKYNSAAFYNNTRSFHNFSSLFGEWTIIKDLKYKLTLGYDFTQTQQGQYNGVNSSNSITNQSQTTASTTNTDGYHYTIENLLTYDKTFAQKHHITFTGLFSSEKNHYQTTYLQAQNIPADVNLNTNLSLGSFLNDAAPNVTVPWSEYGLVSEMARINYSYDGRYALTATIRQDANSTLAAGHQYLAYPAIGAAWTITNEKWMQQYTWIDNLKLRAGYGVTSNGALNGNPYQTLPVLSLNNSSNVPLKYQYGGVASGNAIGYLAGTLANTNLTWQKTAEFNMGLDFGILKDRLTGTIDVYSEKTTGILLPNALPATIGVTSQISNLGSSANKGLEISLSSINFQNKGGFSWTTDFNIAFSREHIVALPNGIQALPANGEFVGWPLNVIYDNKKIGIWQISNSPGIDPSKSQTAGPVYLPVSAQTSPKQYPGQIRVQDVNGDGVINQTDNVIIGTFQPQYTGGLTNRFTYKNVDLSIVIQARMGVMTTVPYLGSGGSAGGWAFLGTGRHTQPYVNYWTPTNQGGTWPEPNDNNQSYLYGSTTQYQDGSWIKARSINLGYTLPSKLLSRAGISSLRVYLNCTNPFVIYAPLRKVDDGIDPESNSYGQAANGTPIAGQNGGSAAAGRAPTVNYLSDPTTRNFILGINLKF
ncbi:MAG: TonB-dependent receptor [Mucilaginibacter sp.]|nr:TonB-dependent receptor [Mucilaginibacter sp.]MDB5109441.1 TonB-dependent receptor [Mucilaginibacter sp.]